MSPPPGADRFRCVCNIVLSAPNATRWTCNLCERTSPATIQACVTCGNPRSAPSSSKNRPTTTAGNDAAQLAVANAFRLRRANALASSKKRWERKRDPVTGALRWYNGTLIEVMNGTAAAEGAGGEGAGKEAGGRAGTTNGGGTKHSTKDHDEQIKQQNSNSATSSTSSSTSSNTSSSSTIPESAFVRQMSSDGILSWVPASEASVVSSVQGTKIDSHDLEGAASLPFDQKIQWFQSQLSQLRVPRSEGVVRIQIRREHILADTFQVFSCMKPQDFRRSLYFEFTNEKGLDYGGVARELFRLLFNQLFNVDFALFKLSSASVSYASTFCCVDLSCILLKCYYIPSVVSRVINLPCTFLHSLFVLYSFSTPGNYFSIVFFFNLCIVNENSGNVGNELYLEYFRFAGQVLAKALFDGHICQHHLSLSLYKHVLAWPCSLTDLEYVDEMLCSSLRQVMSSSKEDVQCMDLTFSTTTSSFGTTETIALKGNGDEEVTCDNRDEYCQLLIKYYLLDRVSAQLGQLLRGFYDVVPQPLVSIFDFQELELLCCGLTKIDIYDWKRHTTYCHDYQMLGENHPVVRWFWECVEEYDDETRCRLLQFVTGSSRVPVSGFAGLQGNDGNVRLFTIDSVSLSTSIFPRAHTCFNRLDLPNFSSLGSADEIGRDKLREALTKVLHMELGSLGFGLE